MTDILNGSLTLIAIFLMGLGLNLTPCVYPMLSVTVSLFGVRQKQSRFKAFIKAFVYVLGMATMYSTLGVFAAMTGGFFGGLLQSKWVILTISILLALLALSMFGAYTIPVSAFILKKASVVRSGGLLKFYASGLLVGIIAAPCIAGRNRRRGVNGSCSSCLRTSANNPSS